MAKKQFKAESKRLLDLMINSIYTHKEIFLRELLSNASDAIDKYYYNCMKDGVTGIDRNDLTIDITLDEENRTITIKDTGCGMTKQELEDNLGIIANSGSLAFKKDVTEQDDVDIIGQFGVGFYSAFMVTSKVTVLTKSNASETAYLWQSEGVDGYSIKDAEKSEHGSVITLYLKEDTDDDTFSEYLDEWQIKNLIKKYSDYVRYPIRMEVSKSRKKEDSPEDKPEWESYKEVETINSMTPIWKKQQSEVSAEDYNNFYKEKFMDYTDPIKVIRSVTEGDATYTALLFIPKTTPFNFYTRDYEKGLQLYASGVLIMDKCSDLLPDHFSFVRGLVDSQDLSLNISREMLQHDRQLKIIANSIEKKIKSELTKFLKKDRDGYMEFFKAFGLNLKYGLHADYGTHKDVLKDLVMFHSSTEDTLVTLAEYTSRLKEDQKYIYYATGESTAKINLLPQTESLKEKGIEVLYLTDDVDEFSLKSLQSYNEKEFKNISDGDLGLDTDEEKEIAEKQNQDNKDLLTFMTEALEGKVKDVRVSTRLKTHPVCLTTEGNISIEMEKVLNAMPSDQKVTSERILELNANHKIFDTMKNLYETDKDKVTDYMNILYNQALLIEGLTIENPVEYANSICNLL